VEWRPLGELGAIVDAWTDLCARAAEPNVFYEPAFALAAAPVFGRDVGAVLVWGENGRLDGLFPLRRARRPMSVITGWTHPFAPLGTPLVDRDRLAATVAAFLDHLAAAPHASKLVMLPIIAAQGPVATAIAAAVIARGGKAHAFDAHERPLLAATGAGRSLDALDGKQRRRLASQRRKLEESGDFVSAFETSPAGVAAALADFLALEARGWKGRAGTAAAQHPDQATFMTTAVTGLAAQGKAMGGRLVHSGDAIAAAIVLRSGNGAWGWKIAYDEAAAKTSPGIQLLLDVTDALTAEPGIAWCDSCAALSLPTIDSLWRDRLAVTDLLIAVTPQAPFGLACRLESWRRGLRAAARTMRDRLRRIRAAK
jgi:CelD/BcsL family acetyltransferase involved in cellulose biosynthesis